MSWFPRQESDRVPSKTLFAIGVVSVVIMAVSLLAVRGFMAEGPRVQAGPAPKPAPTTIGSVEQTLILDTQRGLDARRGQRASLEGWRWVDRDAGVAQIPIERAMQIVVERSDGGAVTP